MALPGDVFHCFLPNSWNENLIPLVLHTIDPISNSKPFTHSVNISIS